MNQRRPIGARTAVAVAWTLLLVAAASASSVGPALSSVQGANRLAGIDISHWQGAINWPVVPRRQVRFVSAKATEGQTFNDPMYTSYRSGAVSIGAAFTGYHYARPDSTSNDAVLEADHFVSVARLHSGNIFPLLDMEESGGLSPSKLIAWTWSWLLEVQRLMGVKAMIYTGAWFWTAYMNDTTQFADAGYKLLWIADWSGKHPEVPAHRWGGYGWTFWQWTDCGSIRGISGCVDRDRYRGTDLRPVEIP